MIQEQKIGTSLSSTYKTGDVVMKHGIVMPDKHPADPSLYLINIGDMTASANNRLADGIWCTNSITPYTRFRDINNNPVSFGSHFPLLPYMPVTVLIPNGGAGQGIVISPAKTNTNVPDPENDSLYMVAQTPNGSHIAMDDKTGNVQVFYNRGNSSVVLSEDNITLEIGKGENGGIAHGTSLSISGGSFIFRTRDSMMKFDESGLSIGFDATDEQSNSSSFSITKDSIRAQAGKNLQLNAPDSISALAEKVTIQGLKDASLVGNHVKVNGAQLTSIKGTQIELEAFWNVQLKGMYVGVQANLMYKESSMIKHSQNVIQTLETSGIASNKSSVIANVAKASFTIASFNAITPKPSWFAGGIAGGIYAGGKAASESVNAVMGGIGVLWLAKTSTTAIIANVLGTGSTMAGAGSRAEKPSTFLFNARNKNNKKSINSGLATSFIRKNQVMENLSVVDPLIQSSMTAVSANGKSPADSVQPTLLQTLGAETHTTGTSQNLLTSSWNRNVRSV